METAFSEFFVGNLTRNNSCFKHFLISLILFVAFIPKVNVLVHSSALKYFKNGNLWRHLASPRREIEIFPWVICRKLNSSVFLIDHLFFAAFCPKWTPIRNLNSVYKITNSSLITHTWIEGSALWYRFKSQWFFAGLRMGLAAKSSR